MLNQSLFSAVISAKFNSTEPAANYAIDLRHARLPCLLTRRILYCKSMIFVTLIDNRRHDTYISFKSEDLSPDDGYGVQVSVAGVRGRVACPIITRPLRWVQPGGTLPGRARGRGRGKS